MKTFRVRSLALLFGIVALFGARTTARAGSYVYGISDDNKIHQVDLTSYLDTVVFDTGLSGLTNGVAWDGVNGRLFYRNPENGSIYFWTQATNTQSYLLGEVLPGFNANASFYNGDYWYIQDGTDILVKANFYFGGGLSVVAHTDSYANFDGTALTSFSFGDIAIDKSGILYGSSNYGLFSVNISGPKPVGFQILSSTFGVRQITLDPEQKFLYGQDHSMGGWYTASLTGAETPLNSSPSVQFASMPLRDIGAAINTPSEVPEPAAWQLLLAGVGCVAIARFQRR